MLTALALAALLRLTLLPALADPVPSEPAPGSVFNEGGTCHVAWETDPASGWTTMNIQLMTGDNIDMVHLSTIATVDGTDPSTTSFDYPCPEVVPNSAIYFYQFTSPNGGEATWTGRFAIADAQGRTVPEPESTQPNGDPIPWGTGRLEDPSQAVPPPAYLNGGSPPADNGTTITTTSTSGSIPTTTPTTIRTETSTSATPRTSTNTNTVTGTLSAQNGAASGTGTAEGAAGTSNGARGAGLSGRGATVGGALATVALVFAMLL